VVYEGSPLTSSRRWEAFREGAEDLTLLAQLNHPIAMPPELRETGNSSPIIASQIEALREQAFMRLERAQ